MYGKGEWHGGGGGRPRPMADMRPASVWGVGRRGLDGVGEGRADGM